MSFVIPSYANKTSVYLSHSNIDRIYTEINNHTCSQQDWYTYLDYISEKDHPLPL